MFTFGSGGCGQLGHNSLLNELTPRVVAELWGAAVTQVSCGRYSVFIFSLLFTRRRFNPK